MIAAGRIPPPPQIVSFDYTEEKTPAVERRCRGCGGPFMALKDNTPPPGSYSEAWWPPALCRGTIDPAIWYWCKVSGDLEMPNHARVMYYPDRRKTPRG